MCTGGGIGFTGGTTCDAGTSCVVLNPYYSQCQPSAQATTPAPPQSTSSGGGSSASSGSGLDAHFKAKGKVYWGTASDQNRFSNAQDSQVTIAQFGQVTPENSMKWDSVRPCLL